MISATELKNGKTFLLNGKPYKVVKYIHSKIGRGGASVKLDIRNLETGKLEKKTFNSTVKVEEINTIKKPLQYLFSDGSNATFMDQSSYEQTEIPISLVKTELRFIKEGDTIDVLFWSFGGDQDKDDKPLSIDISPKATLKIKQTDPGVKGDTASNVYKPAKLENGIQLKVPLFIKIGDRVTVDTRTGEYIERAKSG